MKKISEMTMAEMRTELDTTAEKYNAVADAAEKLEHSEYAKKLVDAFNEAAVFNAYAKCLKKKQPVVALVKQFRCEKVSVKTAPVKDVTDEGKTVVKMTMTVADDVQRIYVMDFLSWCAERNKHPEADKAWKSKANEARRIICGEWDKAMKANSEAKISKTAIKKAAQAMFDAIAIIPGEKGGNAIVANKDIANYIIAAAPNVKCSYKEEIKHSIHFLGNKKWNEIVMDAMYMAVEGKSFDIAYGDPEADANEAAAEPKPEAKK